MDVKRVLLVCTDNRSRSPAGAALLRQRLGTEAEAFEIWSAGTAAQEGAVLHPLTARALTQYGVGIRRHAARRLVLDDVIGADLVLCAERRHRVHVGRLRSAAAAKTFTLAEFARVSPHLHAAVLDDMLAEAVDLRAAHPARQPADDDLTAPGDSDQIDHESVVMRLDRIVTSIAAALAMAAVHVESARQRPRHRHRYREVILESSPGAPVDLAEPPEWVGQAPRDSATRRIQYRNQSLPYGT